MFSAAVVAAGLMPVLFLNKIDKLLALEPDNEACYHKVAQILARLNHHGGPCLSVAPADPDQCNVVFGRGSLSVADAIGGWGFTAHSWLETTATTGGWTDEQMDSRYRRVWGDHYYNRNKWHKEASGGTRGFCHLILRPLRRALEMLQADTPEGNQRLATVLIHLARAVCVESVSYR